MMKTIPSSGQIQLLPLILCPVLDQTHVLIAHEIEKTAVVFASIVETANGLWTR
jgi:hypothetical protein